MKAKLKGIPLRIVDWSETSQIVTLVTDKLGKVTGVAKGAHRPRSAFSGPFDHLCHYQIVWFRGPRARLGQMTESYLYSRPLLFRQNLKAQFWALSCVERTRELLAEEDPGVVYQELREALTRMIQGEDPQKVHNDFSIRLLSSLGFGPVTTYCVIDGRPRQKKMPVPYSARYAGVLCPGCAPIDSRAVSLPFEVSQRIEKVSQGQVAQELVAKHEKLLTRLLTQTIEHVVGKGLRLAPYCQVALYFVVVSFLVGCRDDRPAQEIFYDAVDLYENQHWIRGSWRVDSLKEQYPASHYTPEILWIQALDQKRRGREADARDTLIELLDQYPDHRYFPRALQEIYVGLKQIFDDNAYREGGRLQYDVGLSLVELMEQVASYAPYSQLADEALLYVADTYLGRQDFEEAEEIYRQILSRIDRNSPLEVKAQFHLALSLWDRAVVRIRNFFDRHLRNPVESLSHEDRLVAVRYSDRYPTEASREFKEVIRRFPDSPEAELSWKILGEIDKLKAARLLSLGDFYRFYSKIDSARYYYRRLTQEFPEAEITVRAQKSLDEILEP